jgi:hypothetical protein
MSNRRSLLKPNISIKETIAPKESKTIINVRIINFNCEDEKEILMLFSHEKNIVYTYISNDNTFAIFGFNNQDFANEFVNKYHRFPYHNLMLDTKIMN